MTIVVRKSTPNGRDTIVNVYDRKKRIARLRALTKSGAAQDFIESSIEAGQVEAAHEGRPLVVRHA